LESIEKKVWDVNILAIYLVEDHPGNKYVSPVVKEGLKGAYIPVLIDILPIRAYWILERKWGIDPLKASHVIKDFLKKYDTPQLIPLKKETILKAFELAKKLNHDVYNCLYLAFARQVNAKTIITTDTDFENLCKAVDLKYENPVPRNILRMFKSYK